MLKRQRHWLLLLFSLLNRYFVMKDIMKHGCESEESGRQYQCKSCQERLLRKGQEKLNGESNSRAVLVIRSELFRNRRWSYFMAS